MVFRRNPIRLGEEFVLRNGASTPGTSFCEMMLKRNPIGFGEESVTRDRASTTRPHGGRPGVRFAKWCSSATASVSAGIRFAK
jgi:hypothetical protein